LLPSILPPTHSTIALRHLFWLFLAASIHTLASHPLFVPNMTSKPTVIFVPGAWHLPEVFDTVSSYLISAGYSTAAVRTPSVTKGPSYVQNIDPDVKATREVILKATDAGNDVVLVMHSYGGIPGSAACKGLSKAERAEAGKNGGVVRLVYMCSFAIPEGESLKSFGGGKVSDWCIDNGEYYVATRSDEIFYNDIPKEKAGECIANLQHQSVKSFSSPQTYAAWKYIPSTYLICEDDMAIPAVAQEAMATQPGANMTIERLKASHSPFLSKPKETADVIRRAAGEVF